MITCDNNNDYNIILEYITMIIFTEMCKSHQFFDFYIYKSDKMIKCNMDYLHILKRDASHSLKIELDKNKLMDEYYVHRYRYNIPKIIEIAINLFDMIYNIVNLLMMNDRMNIKYTTKSYNAFCDNVLWNHYSCFNDENHSYEKYTDACKPYHQQIIIFMKRCHLFSLCRMVKYINITPQNTRTIEYIKNKSICNNSEYMLDDDIKIENIVDHIPIKIKDLLDIIIKYLGNSRSDFKIEILDTA